MSKIGIFYGSTTGNTESAANAIADGLGAECSAVDAGAISRMAEYDVLVLGSSTWGLGDLQDDWDTVADSLSGLSLSGKKVAFFGTGDAVGYSDTFVDAMGILKSKLAGTGAQFIGAWPTDGYEFDESASVEGGLFVGLALDEDNQDGDTANRIAEWVGQLKGEIG